MDTQRRYVSLDALRGLDMLVIVGGDRLLAALSRYLPEPAGEALRGQLAHSDWEGLTAYDVVFPLFVFISGVGMCFSLVRRAAAGESRMRQAAHLWLRALLLAALGGLLVNYDLRWDQQRYASVLGLIGISGALAGCAALWVRSVCGRACLAVGLLAGVGVLQSCWGSWAPASCVNAYIDALLCPGRLYFGVLDPEGPLCILSATSLCLLGLLAGDALRRVPGSRLRRAGVLVGAGLLLVAVGATLCGPVIKNMWSAAFVLVTGGISCALFGVAHWLCDGSRGAEWSLPLRIIGTNALVIYLVTSVLRFDVIVSIAFGWLPAEQTPLGHALYYLFGSWLICLYLWRRKMRNRVKASNESPC